MVKIILSYHIHGNNDTDQQMSLHSLISVFLLLAIVK